MSTQRIMYDHERRRHRESALSTLTWIEGRVAEIRRALESDGSTTIAGGAARNVAADVADLTVSLARLQALDEWRFLVADEDGGV